MIPRFALTTLFVLVLALLPACTEEQIQSEWDLWLGQHNSCEVVEDCAVVYAGCPLGCGDGVRAEDVSAGEARAAELIRAWSGGYQNCAYDCLAVELSCTDSRCITEPVEL